MVETIFLIVILIFSVVIHEVSHGYAAYYLGDPTAKLQGRLTLNPIPHIDPIGSILVPAVMALLPGNLLFGWAKPVPYNPYNISHKYANALVAAAGPASNLALALFAGLLIQLLQVSSLAIAGSLITFLALTVLINVVLMVFNLVPIPPLDGSKILFDFLPARFDYIRDGLEQYGFALLLIFVFFLIDIIQPVIFGVFRLIVGGGVGI